TAVPNVAEVAPIGGFVKQYQVVLKPERLLAYKLPIKDIVMAVERSNNDVGGSVVEMSESEYMVRSRGDLKGMEDLSKVVVVGLVCILFLLHARSELVAIFVVPSSVLVSLLIMHLMGINANIMSLGGIAIAIGVMVDSAIIMVENAHKHLDREEERVHAGQEPRPRSQIIMEAAKEVGPSLFFSLLIITVKIGR